MDFIDQLQELSAKVSKICNLLQTEEATKNARKSGLAQLTKKL